MKLSEQAQKNLETRFKDNPCRGIVCGIQPDKARVQISWTMGRSSNSQNRIYVVENDVLRTEAADPSKVDFANLIIYNAMRSTDLAHIVSNGNQTDAIAEELIHSRTFPEKTFPEFVNVLQAHYCEPDAPVFTPRISGFMRYEHEGTNAYMSILKADPFAKAHWIAAAEKAKDEGITREKFSKPGMKASEVLDAYNQEIGKRAYLDHTKFPTVREFFEMPLIPGFGYCLTTYAPGNSLELPSFEGEPFLVPIEGNLERTMGMIWDNLEPDWRVSIGGKTVVGTEYSVKAKNRFEKVEAPK